MDKCRISWGEVTAVGGPFISVSTAPLLLVEQKLTLGEPLVKKYVRRLESDYDIEQLKKGDLVTIHWDVVCEKVTSRQVAWLRKYTLRHIALANETL
jgi:hypothetical protein